MTDRLPVPISEARRQTRSQAPMSAVGVSGVVHFNGLIYDDDYDRAWQGDQRTKTIIKMLNDPIITASLTGIEMLIRRVNWRVEPVNDSAEAVKVAGFVQTCFDDMVGFWPGDTLAKILTYLGWGWACLEIIYKVREGESGRSPSRYSDGMIGWAKWALRPQPTRYGWEFDQTGEPTALIQIDPQTWRQIPISLQRCLLFRYGGRTNSPEGTTPLRGAYDAWWRKSRIQQIEGIGIERDLAGLPYMRIPSEDIVNQTEAYQAATKIVTNIRQDSQAGIVLSSDRDPETKEYLQEFGLVSTGGQRAVTTDPIVRRYANELATVFLAAVMRVGQDTHGSFALAEAQGGLLEESIGAHLDLIGDVIGSQGIPRLIQANQIDPSLTPKLVHGGLESRDLASLGTYIEKLAKAGLLLDTPELVEFVHGVAGLPVPRAAQIAQMQADTSAEQVAAPQVSPPQGETPVTPQQPNEPGNANPQGAA